MKSYRIAKSMVIPAVGMWLMPLLALGVAPLAQSQYTSESGVQVLTRGPVHEAFAEAYVSDVSAGIVITRTVYDPIVELPPDQRPDGLNVSWIPGYWSWDDDRTDFIWVSGVWRDIPPGRQWIPGYWTPTSGGSQWISGFWGVVAENEVTYLPPPPAPLEVGPSSPIPTPGHVWAPGNWIWQQSRYAWQPGYWVIQQPEWVWTPAHYIWTPRGHVYVPGYWDHDLVNRGVMFAPVYYDQPVYTRPSYYYSPSIVIDLGVIAASLFIQKSSRHYYYGDYYDSRYEDRGYIPWHSTHATQYGNDPLYAYYRSTQLLNNPNWDNYVSDQFIYRRDHIDARPPQTLALQVNINNNNINNNININNNNNLQNDGVPARWGIGKSLSEMVQSKSSPLRFSRVEMEERKQIETRGKEVHKLQFERARIEAAPAVDAKSDNVRATDKPVKVELPASPVAARTPESSRGVRTPPPVPVAPKLQAADGKELEVNTLERDVQIETPKTEEKRYERAPRSVTNDSNSEMKTPRSEISVPKTQVVEPTPEIKAPRSENSDSKSEVKEPKSKTRTPKSKATESKSDERAPRVQTNEPKSEVQAPKSENNERKIEERAPGTETNERKYEEPIPRVHTNEPKSVVPAPKSETNERKYEERAPRVQTNEPKSVVPAPKSETNERKYEERAPRVQTNEPKSVVPTPKSETNERKYEERAPRVQTNEPKSQVPVPKSETNERKYEERAPRVESAGPKSDSKVEEEEESKRGKRGDSSKSDPTKTKQRGKR